MAKITNIHGLPEALVRAVEQDPYDSGGADISVTKLIDSPQINALRKAHEAEIEVDVTDMIPALMGQSIHLLLERAAIPGAMLEHRFFAECQGWKVSGQADWLHPQARTLIDYKVTTVYKSKGDDKWDKQLNVLRWLALQNNVEVDTAYICAIYRDWMPSKAAVEAGYPRARAELIPIPLWPMGEVREYVTRQVTAHQQAALGQRVLCTDEERWMTPAKWALMQYGKKRAIRLYDSEPKLPRLPEDQYVEYRPGQYRRCEQYCDVARWCTQWAETHHDSTPHDETDEHPEA